MNDPIYQSRSYTKNGKHYWLNETAWIFDCPHCEVARDHFSRENALTHMDMHFFHIHPDKHIPLCPADVKEKVWKWYRDFRLHTFAPLGTIRPPAKSMPYIQLNELIEQTTDPELNRLLAEEVEIERDNAEAKTLLQRGKELRETIKASRN